MRPVFELINFDGTPVEEVGNDGDVSDRFVAQGSYIRRDSTAEVDGTATFMFGDVEGFDFGRHLLAVKVIVSDTFGREEDREWRMGNWVMQPPDIHLDSNELIQINCLDAVSLISTRLERVFSVGPGINISAAITQLLARHGIIGLSGVVDEEGNDLEIGLELATYGNWNITDPITYLQVANQMLEASAYVGLFANRFGQLTSYRWRPLEQYRPRWDFDYHIPNGSNIVPPTRRLGQREQIPNVWVGVAVPVDIPGGGEGQIPNLELQAGSGSPYAIDAQGGRRNPRVIQFKVSSVEELARASGSGAGRRTSPAVSV